MDISSLYIIIIILSYKEKYKKGIMIGLVTIFELDRLDI